MMSISGMTITCFAACYVLALAVELSRLLFRWRVPAIAPLSLSAIGLFAHSLYLIGQAQHELAQRVTSPLSSWYDFCLLAAWVVAGAYLGLMIRRRENAIGVFLLPLVLGLICVAAFQDRAPFPARTAHSVWRLVHGLTLMLGTTAVTLGFATGLMYLLQSYRLKQKLPPSRGFRLPSLEWLQKFNREALFVSTCLLAVGLVSGVTLNLISKSGDGGQVSWTDPVVLSSGVLFLWLTAVTIFESLYRPAREGNKVAYLTLASFVFLGLALYFVLFGSHATVNAIVPSASTTINIDDASSSREATMGNSPSLQAGGKGTKVSRSPEGGDTGNGGPIVSPPSGLKTFCFEIPWAKAQGYYPASLRDQPYATDQPVSEGWLRRCDRTLGLSRLIARISDGGAA